jgi:hypothetical protein
MEQYLTAKELGERIKMSPGTIRNLVWKKVFIEDIHFLKPTPRKLIFIWSAVEDWLHGGHAGSPYSCYLGCGDIWTEGR